MDIRSTGLVYYWMLENSRLKEKTAMIVLRTMGIQSFACSVARRLKQRVPEGQGLSDPSSRRR